MVKALENTPFPTVFYGSKPKRLPVNIEDYKKERPTWKPTAFNFKGNTENKRFIATFKEENQFANEGEALDYIVQSFQGTDKELQSLTDVLTAKDAEIQKLRLAVELGKNEVQKITNELTVLKASQKPTNEFVFPEEFNALKLATETVLPKLFKLEDASIPVSNKQFLLLLLEYCERDPSKEFPFQPAAQIIVDEWKKTQAPAEPTV